ncbi:MAG: YkgJ family cysteine cluster protein [Deltaproteobacteria bacterium]|nr:YkgJ family cysteine cluster protein [Deltaproteobacteria bacterium]MBW2658722.1 YkgJ family cysteine cluster protein [Deltaproteobacteria bacterium]
MNVSDKVFPEGMIPLGEATFTFGCHSGVSCFNSCCKDVDLTLYPFDVITLKNYLGIDSETFMREHSFLVKGENPFFPTVKLKLNDDENKSCPFLTDPGCSVYQARPSACRTYPLERAVDRKSERGVSEEYYFMTSHPYCLGHKEEREFTVDTWIRNQQLFEYNSMNELWVSVETLFSTNPWKGEGAGGERQQLAFMVCYNIDGFRRFSDEHRLIKQFRLDSGFKKRISTDDGELLKFGFEWLKTVLGGNSTLIKR